MPGRECSSGEGGLASAQALLAQKRGLQQPKGGPAQKKGSAKGRTLAVPISKGLRGGRGQTRGGGSRGRGGRGSVGGRGQPAESWNPASLKITIKNDRVRSSAGPLSYEAAHRRSQLEQLAPKALCIAALQACTYMHDGRPGALDV